MELRGLVATYMLLLCFAGLMMWVIYARNEWRYCAKLGIVFSALSGVFLFLLIMMVIFPPKTTVSEEVVRWERHTLVSGSGGAAVQKTADGSYYFSYYFEDGDVERITTAVTKELDFGCEADEAKYVVVSDVVITIKEQWLFIPNEFSSECIARYRVE